MDFKPNFTKLTVSGKIELIFPEFIYQEIVEILREKNAPETTLLIVESIYEARDTIKIPINKIIEYLGEAKAILKEKAQEDLPLVAPFWLPAQII